MGVGVSGPLFVLLLEAPQSTVLVAWVLHSSGIPHITGGEARASGQPLSSWLETHPKTSPPPYPHQPGHSQTQEAKVTRPSLDWPSQVYSPHFTLTLDSGGREAGFPDRSWLPERPTSPSAHLSFYHHHRLC